MCRWARCEISIRTMASSTARWSSARNRPNMPRRARRPRPTTSRTVIGVIGGTGVDCITNEMRARAARGSRPSTRRRPEATGTSPARADSSVDLPDPLGPMTATTPTAGTRKVDDATAT